MSEPTTDQPARNQPHAEQYDAFISYSSADRRFAVELQEALGRRTIDGRPLRIWFDQRNIDELDEVLERIDVGLNHTRTVLALMSRNFIASNPCRYEAMRTLSLSGQDGINRYVPIRLGEDLPDRWQALLERHLLPWSGAEETAAALVQRIQDTAPPSPGRRTARDPLLLGRHADLGRFVGRLDAILDIHSAQSAMQMLDQGTLSPRRTVSVSGIGGMGKSALALKYAQEFRHSFPGGTVWLDAGGDKVDNVALDEATRDAVFDHLRGQIEAGIEEIHRGLGLEKPSFPTSGKPLELLKTARARLGDLIVDAADGRPGRVLWVIDDLPNGMDGFISTIGCPLEDSLTLVTTRDRIPAAHATPVWLDQLEPDEALRLFRLAARNARMELDEKELGTAAELAAEVGHYPLALDLLAAQIQLGRKASRLLAGVRRRAAGVIDVDDRLFGELPTLHRKSIVATLQTTFLEAAGRHPAVMPVLRLLAATAAEPEIPVGLLLAAAGAHGFDEDELDDALQHLNQTGLLDEYAGAEDASDEDLIVPQHVHAMVRAVAKHLAGERLAPWRESAEDRAADAAVAQAAAVWLHDTGDALRNSDDAGAARWFERARVPLKQAPDTRELRIVHAACLRGVARQWFRQPNKTVASLAEAQELIDTARALIAESLIDHPGDDELLLEDARIAALKGDVLDAQLSRGFLGPAVDEGEVNLRALDLVLEQAEYRQSRLDRGLLTNFKVADPPTLRDTHVDAARSWINVPGRLINRVKLIHAGVVPASARHSDPMALLDQAHDIYAEIEGRRSAFFPVETRKPGDIEEIAACTNGRAIVGYVRGNLVLSSREARILCALDALAAAISATTQRWRSGNEGNASKSVLLAGKLALAIAALLGRDQSESLTRTDAAIAAARALPLEQRKTGGLPTASAEDLTWDEELALALDPEVALAPPSEMEYDDAESPPARGSETVSRRDAAARALVGASEALRAALGAGRDDSPTLDHLTADQRSAAAAVALGVATSAAAWLAIAERASGGSSTKADQLATEWRKERADWLAER